MWFTLKPTKTRNAGDGFLQLSSVLILFFTNTETMFYSRDFKTTTMHKFNIYDVVKNKEHERRGIIFRNWIEKEKDHIHLLKCCIKKIKTIKY